MKRIIKKEPEFFSKFISKANPKVWKDLNDRGLGKDIRKFILKSEQNYQCAYTEVNISADNSSSHIDHYRKRDIFSILTFKWNNLLVASNIEFYGAKYKDKYIKRGDEAIYESLLDPSVDDPKDYFYYSLTGRISPKSNDKESENYKKAYNTIEVFNLNERSLEERRKGVALVLNSYVGQFEMPEVKVLVKEFDTYIEAIYNS